MTFLKYRTDQQVGRTETCRSTDLSVCRLSQGLGLLIKVTTNMAIK